MRRYRSLDSSLLLVTTWDRRDSIRPVQVMQCTDRLPQRCHADEGHFGLHAGQVAAVGSGHQERRRALGFGGGDLLLNAADAADISYGRDRAGAGDMLAFQQCPGGDLVINRYREHQPGAGATDLAAQFESNVGLIVVAGVDGHSDDCNARLYVRLNGGDLHLGLDIVAEHHELDMFTYPVLSDL